MKIFFHLVSVPTSFLVFEVLISSFSLLLSLISVIAAMGVFCQMGELKSIGGFPFGEFGEEEFLSSPVTSS